MTLMRRPRRSNVAFTKSQSGQYVVMFLGSSSVDGWGATLPWANFVNQLAALMVTHTLTGSAPIAKRQVFAWRKGDAVKPPNDFASPNSGQGWGFSRSTLISYTPGMFFFNGGIGGRDSSNFFQVNEAQTAFNTLLPDLVIHMVGSNDYNNNRSPADYATSVQGVIDYTRNATGGRVRHVFLHTFERLDVNPSTKTWKWAEYGNALRQVCNANLDAQFVDMAVMWETLGIKYGAAYPNTWISSDGVHCTDDGYKQMALFAAQGIALTSWRGQTIWALLPDNLGLATGAAVASVPGPSGSLEPNPATQGTAGFRPVTGTLNGKATVKFDGVDDALDLTATRSYGLPVTLVFVVKALGQGQGAGNVTGLFSRTSTDHLGYLFAIQRVLSSNTAFSELSFLSNFGTRLADNPITVRNDTAYVIGVTMRADGYSNVYLHALNSIKQAVAYSSSDTTTIGDQTLGPFINSFRMGTNTGRAAFSTMEVGDTYLIQGELTQAEMNAQMQAMSTKYGLGTLPANYVTPSTAPVYIQPTLIEVADTAVPASQLNTANPTITVALPPNRQPGDLMVMSASTYSGNGVNTTPTGWTLASRATTGTSPRGNFYYKICGPDEPSTVAVASSKNSGESVIFEVALIRAPHAVLPVDVAASSASNTTSTGAHITPTVSTVNAASRTGFALTLRSASGGASGTYTWPAGMNKVSNFTDTISGDTTPVTMSLAWARTSTATSQGTVTASFSVAQRYGAATLVVRPFPPSQSVLVTDGFDGTVLDSNWRADPGYPSWVINGDGTVSPAAGVDYSAMARPLSSATTTVVVESRISTPSTNDISSKDGSGPSICTSTALSYASAFTTNVTTRAWWVYKNNGLLASGSFLTPQAAPLIVQLYLTGGQFAMYVNGGWVFQVAATDTAYGFGLDQDFYNSKVKVDSIEARTYA